MGTSQTTRRRWFQFRLRTLLILLTFVCVGLSCLAVRIQRGREQQAAVEALRRAGNGSASYDYEGPFEPPKPEYTVPNQSWTEARWGEAKWVLPELPMTDIACGVIVRHQPPGPRWLRELVGDDYFADVIRVGLRSNEHLILIHSFSQLRHLDLGSISFMDDDLIHLEGLLELQTLDLAYTSVTDRGLQHLTGCPQLRVLNLSNTSITDAGLVHLAKLKQLQTLDLSYTKVSDAGLMHLRALPQLECLGFKGIPLTEARATQLQHLNKLRNVYMQTRTFIGSQLDIPKNQLEELSEQLPNLRIDVDAYTRR